MPQEIARLGKAYHNRRNVNIIVDSCADFAQGVAERLGVKVIEFSYVGPDGEHLDDNWRSQTPHEFYEGMRNLHGITGELADRIYEKLYAFANFGFPESHAQSFASLVF